MRRIERLPDDIHGPVRSGTVISDFSRIVDELVFNSLEAGATKVFVAVGVSSCYVKVVDNGCGIARDGLVLLGERFATSKVRPMDLIDNGSEYLEFHGEALCSISDISLLEIVTKARGKPNGYKKILKNCRCLFFGINDDREDVGTTVIVRDIFYNQPVRRKHMESSPKKVLDSIKMSVLRIALVHVNTSFRVVDVESTHELLHTTPAPSPLPILVSNFGIENAGSLYEINSSDGAMNISGYISGPVESLLQKGIQYVYINSRFISKGPIHKLLNQLPMKFELLYSWKPNAASQSDKRNRCHFGPIFIINLQCPRSHYDILTSERSRTSVEFKDWGPVLTFIENEVLCLWSRSTSKDLLVASEHGRKQHGKYNCQTSLNLHDTQMKQLPRKYDDMPAWEDCLSLQRKLSPISKHKKQDIGYIGQACHDSLVGHGKTVYEHHSLPPALCFDFPSDHPQLTEYISNDGISSSELDGILPEFYNDISVESGMSDDSCLEQDQKKLCLRSCSFKGSFLHNSLHPRSDENFEFGNNDSRIEKRQVHYGDSFLDEVVHCGDSFLDEVDLSFGGGKMQRDGGPLFLCSPLTQHAHEGSEFLTEDFLRSPLVFRNILPDSSEVLKCSSSQLSLSPGWSEDDDIIDENLIGSGLAFGKDVGYDFSTCSKDQDLTELCLNTKKCTHMYSGLRKDDDLIGRNLNEKEYSQQPKTYCMNSFPDDKDRTYSKTETGEVCWDDLETSFSPMQVEKLCETPYCGKERNKKYSVPSLSGSPYTGQECRRPNSRNCWTFTNRKKSLIRSHSAPPFYKSKRKFLDLSGSSTILSAKSNIQTVGIRLLPSESNNRSNTQVNPEIGKLIGSHSQKSIGEYDPCQMEISTAKWSFAKRSGVEREPEGILIEDNSSPKKNQKMEPVECIENDKGKDFPYHGVKEIQDMSSSGGKWRSYGSPIAVKGGSELCNKYYQHAILDISSDIFQLAGDSLIPKSIDKSALEGAKVLNQVDNKFIAVVAGTTISVIDQHAADERIRLEELRQKVLSGEMKSITYLDDAQELVLPEIGYQLLHNYADQIQKWGWICNIRSNDTSSFTKNLDSLHKHSTVVKLIAVPCILGVNLTEVDLLEFLQQLADTDGSSTIPPSVHSILNSKACRGAIMFGDTLLPSECSLIVEELTRTSLCFQCAHGRPTTVPLVNLNVLHNKIAKLCSDGSWHGLYQHELKLERTAERLNYALT